jgi:hypothetical protein
MKLFFIVMTTLLAIRATAEESTWTITEDCIVGIPVAASGSSSHRRLNNPLNNPTTTSTNHSNNTKHDFTIKVQEEKHVYASAQEVGFLTLCIFIGVISRTWIEPKLCFHFIPYTVILLVIGIMIGNLSIFTQLDESTGLYNSHCHLVKHGCNSTAAICDCKNWFDYLNVNILADLSPHVILYVFLPPLIFESAFFMDIHIFVRSFTGILSLSVLGVCVATLVTGLFLQYVASQFSYSCINYAPLQNFDTAMMMGAMLSATDPVAVVQLLKSLGAAPSLGTLIEGESLLNDGTAYAMFLIFQARSQWYEVSTYNAPLACMIGIDDNVTSCRDDQTINVEGEQIVLTSLNLIILGPTIGYCVGRLAVLIVELVYNDVVIETTMTVLGKTFSTVYSFSFIFF